MADMDASKLAKTGSGEMAVAAPVVPAAEFRVVLPFGMPAFIAAIISLATCYSSILASLLLGIDSLGLNPHVQAVLMWSFALLAALALWRDRKHHRNNVPVALAAVAVGILVATLYVRYAVEAETLAYVLLVIATVLNQNVFLSFLNRRVMQQAAEIGDLNRTLEHRVEDQGHEIGRLVRLKQFLPPQVAELVVSDGRQALLDTHRRYIACLFCDIRGFTAASENVEPEEVISMLQTYHDCIGALVTRHNGTIGYRAGDGMMAFFNDPIPCDEPVWEAVRLALDIRAAFDGIREPWLKLGHPIGIGIGIACGYATLGLVGFHGRSDYTAIGGVVNVAARLCDKAADGQILLGQRAYMEIESRVEVDDLGPLELKGVRNPIQTFALRGVRQEQ